MEEKLAQDLQKLQDRARELGATATKLVDVAHIKTGAWTRMKCRYGCPNYGSNLCCPPYTPDYERMQKFLAEYRCGVLVEYTMDVSGAGPESFVSADMKMSNALLEILLCLERDAFLLNHYRSFALKAGRCRFSVECILKNCVNPLNERPTRAACGIDVFALANDNGFKMEVITGPVTQLKIYGLLLVE